jgi:transposase-like protein
MMAERGIVVSHTTILRWVIHDKHGKTVDFLLRPDRSIAAAQAFFRKALSTSLPRWPRKITLDGHKVNLKCAGPVLNRSGTPIYSTYNAPVPVLTT